MKNKTKGRAANGMGTVRQRKDGLWEGRYTAPDGHQRSIYAKSEAEVTKKLRAAQHEIDSGAWREPSKVSVTEWLKIWLRDYCNHTTESTRTAYERFCRVHFAPVIGKIKLTKLSPVHVRHLFSVMQKEGKAPKTIYTARGVLKTSLNAAVHSGIIPSNPADGVPVPRVTRPEMHIIDRPMFSAFLSAVQQTQYPEALIILLLTGLRSGELRGLMWSDIDEARKIIHVRRQLHTLEKGTPTATAPKNGKSRDIIVGQEVMDTLRAQRRRLAEMKLKANNWTNDDYVFKTPSGKPLHDRALLEAVHQVAEIINMPGLHTHDLRHSYAVAALRSGIDVKTVQHNLGHATAAMTLDTYAAYTSDAGQIAAEKMSDYWKKALD